MGRNGSGKTTLLRVIAGLRAPLSGTAWRAAGRVAYLPQNPAALLHRVTVAAEVAWSLRDDHADARATRLSCTPWRRRHRGMRSA